MDRLQAELRRLYGTPDAPPRALVLQLAGPAPWTALAKAWRGVQADLQWPAPAIAIDGRRAYQLWFSLAQPVDARAADALLSALCKRYLAGVPAERITLFPREAGGASWQQLPPMPPREATEGQWSAFVAPDLAALFADEPWLDLAPGAEAQADLLATLKSTATADWQRAGAQLAPAPSPAAATGAQAADRCADPRQFLLDVMNDRSVDLHLRIEAAKALLATP